VTATTSQRLHSLDAIRAVALLLGIVLHTTLSFAAGVDFRLWPIHDREQSEVASVLMFLIHTFRMPVFFLLAGFFARLLLHRSGEREFWRNRVRRIAMPLVLGWLGCMVAIVPIVIWALTKMHGGAVPQSVSEELAGAGLTFLHLWFLYVLLWLYAGMSLLRRLVAAAEPTGALPASAASLLHIFLSSRSGTLVLAVPVSVALYLQTNWQWWMGVPTPGYTLIPPAVPLFIFGYCFVLGWLIHREQLLLVDLAQHWIWNAVIGGVCALACLALAGTAMRFDVLESSPAKLVFASAYAVSLTSWMFAFVGAGIRFVHEVSARIRFIADASYWMYIAHLPVVMALQTAAINVPLPWLLKFIAINVLALTLLLGTYHLWAQSGWASSDRHVAR
jgi:glucans biosynthesis protein C